MLACTIPNMFDRVDYVPELLKLLLNYISSKLSGDLSKTSFQTRLADTD